MPKDVPDWTTGTDIPWVKVGDKVTTGLGPGNMTTGPIPPGTRALAVVPANSGVTLSGLQVVGHVTGIPYHSSPTIQVTQGWVEYPFNGAADSSADLTWTNCSAIGSHIQVFAVPFSVELPAVGQGTMGVSVPVAIASDQSPIQVTTLGPSDVDANIDEVGGQVISLGAAASVNSFPVVIANDQVIGNRGQAAMAASAPVVIASDQTDLNVATRGGVSLGVNVTAYGGTGVALGQHAMAGSIPVVVASDQTLPVDTLAPPFATAVNAVLGVGSTLYGVNGLIPAKSAAYRGIIVYISAAGGGAGTVTVNILDYDPIFGFAFKNVLGSIALATGTTAILRVYPGLPAVANASANDIVGPNINLQAIVAGAALTVVIDFALIP